MSPVSSVPQTRRPALRRLRAASRALGGASCLRTACRAAVQALAPETADGCIIDLLASDTATGGPTFERLEVAHHDAGVALALRDVTWHHGAPAAAAAFVSLLHNGQPQALFQLDPGHWQARAPVPCVPPVQLLLGAAAAHVKGVVLVPIEAAGQLQGMMTLVDCRAYDTQVSADDLALAQEVCSKLALVLANFRLTRDLAQAHRARDEFLSLASHELRTPLTVLTLQLDRLGRMLSRDDVSTPGAPSHERIAEKLAGTTWQTTRLSHVVDKLLHAATLQGGPLQLNLAPLDVRELCRDVVGQWQPAAAAASCSLLLRCPDPIQACWDGVCVGQVLVHLLTNAIKYGAGAPIDIDVVAEAQTVVLRVRDRGRGVSDEAAARIFDNYERDASSRDGGGLGMGLFISRHIVEAHFGTLRLMALAPAGGLFEMRLPQDARSAYNEKSSSTAAAAQDVHTAP